MAFTEMVSNSGVLLKPNIKEIFKYNSFYYFFFFNFQSTRSKRIENSSFLKNV